MKVLPKSDYGDPSLIAERREARTIGCAACALHRLNAARTAFECGMSLPGYPNQTNRSCTWWTKKGGRK